MCVMAMLLNVYVIRLLLTSIKIAALKKHLFFLHIGIFSDKINQKYKSLIHIKEHCEIRKDEE